MSRTERRDNDLQRVSGARIEIGEIVFGVGGLTTSSKLILILEDSPNRLALMRDALERPSTGIEIRSFDNVWAMRKELGGRCLPKPAWSRWTST